MSALYEFGRYTLNVESETLWRDDELVSVSPKSIEVLRLLVENHGEIVSKQQIFDHVWADTFVEDGVLTQNIYTLRNTLGTDENGRQFIETVPRRGYRFAGKVKKLDISGSSGERDAASFTSGFEDSREHSAKNLKNIPVDRLSGTISAPAADTKMPPSSSVKVGQSRRSYSTVLLVVLGSLALAAAGFGIYSVLRNGSETTDSYIAPIEQLRFQKITDSGDVVYPTVSPDSKLLAYVRLDEENASVWVKQIEEGSPIQTLPASRKGYHSLAFSPDGRYLFYREGIAPGSVYQVPVLGGTPKKIIDNIASEFGISPDGRQIAFIRRKNSASFLMLSDIDGSNERRLGIRTSPFDFQTRAPAWSPDGSKIIVVSGRQRQSFPKLTMIDIHSGKETELKTPEWRGIFRVLWMPEGDRLIITARAANEPYSQMWMLSLADEEVRRLTNDLEGYFWLSLSADAKVLVTRQQRIISHLWLLPGADIDKAIQLTFGGRARDGYAGLTWTRGGKIVFSRFANNTTDLYSMLPDGSDKVQLTINAGYDNKDPAASPDGGHILFTSDRTDTNQLWIMDNDGGNQRQMILGANNKESVISAASAPDGKTIYFIKLGEDRSVIWKASIEGGESVPVSRLTNAAADSFVAVSPDGRWLAYRHVSGRQETGDEEQTMRIGVLPSDGNGEPKLFELPLRRAMVRWSADSSAFYYSSGAFDTSGLHRQPINEGNPQKILDFPDRIFNFAWSPDGRDLVVARGKQLGDAVLVSNLY